MIAGWAAEGVGTKRVVRLPGKLPGLYMIQTDEKGERRFFHWRDSAAARSLMDLPETDGYPELAGRPTTSSISRRSRCRSTARRGEARLMAALERARDCWDALCLRYQFPRARLARSRRRAPRLSRGLCGRRYRARLDRGSAAALSRRKQRQPDGAAFRVPEVVLKLSEPASILRLDGVFARGQGRAGDEARRRYHRGRRQFCGGLYCRAPCGRRPDRSRARRTSSRRRRGMLSRCDHPALRHAAQANPETAQSLARRHMTADTRQEKLAALFKSATVIPVLTIERLEDAVPLARALVAGGVRVLEVTLRTPVADRSRQGDHRRGAGGHCRHRHDPERGRSGARRSARRQIRHQPGRDAGTVEGRSRERLAVRAGDRDRFRTDAGAGRTVSIS